MTNAVRGRVSVELAGQTYQLEFTIDALCQLEDRLGEPAVQILQRMLQDNTTKFLRTMIWGALREHHEELTEKQAGELMRAEGGQALRGKVVEAFLAAWPDEVVGNPQTRQDQTTPATAPAEAGTGDTSSSSGTSAAAESPTPTGAKPPARSKES